MRQAEGPARPQGRPAKHRGGSGRRGAGGLPGGGGRRRPRGRAPARQARPGPHRDGGRGGDGRAQGAGLEGVRQLAKLARDLTGMADTAATAALKELASTASASFPDGRGVFDALASSASAVKGGALKAGATKFAGDLETQCDKPKGQRDLKAYLRDTGGCVVGAAQAAFPAAVEGGVREGVRQLAKLARDLTGMADAAATAALKELASTASASFPDGRGVFDALASSA